MLGSMMGEITGMIKGRNNVNMDDWGSWPDMGPQREKHERGGGQKRCFWMTPEVVICPMPGTPRIIRALIRGE